MKITVGNGSEKRSSFLLSGTISQADEIEFRIKGTKAKNVILFIDCCYSGAGVEEIMIQRRGKKVFIISSVWGANVAAIATEKDIGSGAFSLEFMKVIEEGQARDF